MNTTRSALDALLSSSSGAACVDIFAAATRGYRIDTFACGVVDFEVRERSVFYAIAWPDDWKKFYLKSQLLSRDPVVEGLRHRKGPFTWSDLREDRTLSNLGREALRLISENGWSEGLAVPIRDGQPARCGLVSLVRRSGIFSEPERTDLIALSIAFYSRMRSLAASSGFPAPPAGLTERELQALSLLARGLTDQEMAAVMGVSTATAHEYVEKTRKKLGVKSRAQAAAVGVSLGIICV